MIPCTKQSDHRRENVRRMDDTNRWLYCASCRVFVELSRDRKRLRTI